MFEYFPVFLHAHLYLLTGKQLGWAHTARLTYKKGSAAERAEQFYRAAKKILHQAQKSGAPRRGTTPSKNKNKSRIPPALLFCPEIKGVTPRAYLSASTRRTKESAMPSTRCMPASEKPWPSPANTSSSGAPILFRRLFAVRKGNDLIFIAVQNEHGAFVRIPQGRKRARLLKIPLPQRHAPQVERFGIACPQKRRRQSSGMQKAG